MRRSVFEQKIDVLKVLKEQGRLSVTRTMYAVNTDWVHIKFFIQDLSKRGLVLYSPPDKENKIVGQNAVGCYTLTDLGRDTLEQYEDLMQVLMK